MNVGVRSALSILLVWIAPLPARAREIPANPSNYLPLVRRLSAGDTLILAAGTYEGGLAINDLIGASGKPIVIEGPATGKRAVFVARPRSNTVSITDSAFVTLRNLELQGKGVGVDAVKAEGHAHWAHDITLEGLLIHGYNDDLQTVGISTKCVAWNWVIRDTVIRGAGTGIYLGSSDGTAPFVNGLIEYNVIADTIGYNMEIKHQKERPALGLDRAVTIIRHNVFDKRSDTPQDKARPNLLVGHAPLAGTGIDDAYWIYGNYFTENPRESLFQGEGNVALYSNVFVNSFGDAVRFQPHNAVPRDVWVFGNTVLARERGISVQGGAPGHRQRVEANAVFASKPIRATDQTNNIAHPLEAAGQYLIQPFTTGDAVDLHPKPGALAGPAHHGAPVKPPADWDRDFDGNMRSNTVRGAYACEGPNCGWQPKLERKPRPQPSH